MGAGASLANALYFRARRLPQSRPPLDQTFFGTVAARKIPLTQSLRAYISALGIDPDGDELRAVRMEELFKDVFFDFLDAPTNRLALNAYIDLVQLYLRVLRETTNWLNTANRTGAPVGRLIADAAQHSSHVSVITFNHDLVIENEISRRVNLRHRWCVDEGYGSLGPTMQPMHPNPGEPTFHLHEDHQCDHNRPITVLKLHGSLNWVVRIQGSRPTANFLSGQGNINREINLLVRRQIVRDQTIVRAGRGRTSWHTWPVVVPPVYAKEALRRAIHTTWDDARAALKEADRVVFFGYSLPGIDIEAEKLFQRSLAANDRLKGLDIINPAPESAGRFAGVTRTIPVRWYPEPADFLALGGCKFPS
jgi:hypothetical protein